MPDISIPTLAQLPAKPKRIVLHWTGGGKIATGYERVHYHYLIEQSGRVVTGVPVAANMRKVSEAQLYAAHTKGFNSFSVGVSFCGMAGVASPQSWKKGIHGPAPLTEQQVITGCWFIGSLCRVWGLAVSQDTVFTHAEAERVHGVDQLHKWDIDVLMFRPDDSPEEICRFLREQIEKGAIE
jgi:N-acetyl-anhydromuramyl-L-alanine amidase AmpD